MSWAFGKNHSSSNNNSAFNQNFNGTDNYNTDTKFSQTGTSTSTPTNPDWVSAGAGDIFAGARRLSGVDPSSYVAGPSPLQITAGNAAGGLTSSPYNFDAAADITRGVAQASPVSASPLTVSGGKGYDYISKYMDPALSAEVNSTLNDFDVNAGRTRAQQALDLAKSGAFGGSGAAITQSMTEGELARARAAADAGLRTQAFTQALGAGSEDANRATQARIANANNDLQEQSLRLQGQQQRLGAAQQLGDLSTQYNQNLNQNANTQASIGAMIQQIMQNKAQAPLALQGYLAQLFAGLPLNLFHGQTDNTTQSGTQNENGTETQTGTSSGTSSGNTSGGGFSFGLQGSKGG